MMNDTRGLWRGKRVDNGEWVKGDLSRMGEQLFIAGKDHWKFAVDPSTTGECTGLRDKNGKLIFEGDIVKTKYGRLCVITWFSSSDFVGFDLNPIEDKHSAPTVWDLYESENLEIVGNIHDNPEPLKGVDDNGSRG